MPPKKKQKILNNPWEQLSVELGEKILEFIPEPLNLKTHKSLTETCRETHSLFARSLRNRAVSSLLSAIYMGDEERALKIVTTYPNSLFEKASFKMPFLDADGSVSSKSQQIYYDVSPLELSLYTGDFQMWNKIFPLIPNDKLEEVIALMQKIKRGGPDLVKIDRDPTRLSWADINYYASSVYTDTTCTYDLLVNPDGIICYCKGREKLFYYANQATKTLEPLQARASEKDAELFADWQKSINAMAMNSSRRSSDAEHALIQRIFGKKLERNGIHYEINGKHFQDTFDGCNRLINSYRKQRELYIENDATRYSLYREIDFSWINDIGVAQRYAMPHIIQRYLEKKYSFHPVVSLNVLRATLFTRTNECFNVSSQKEEKFYPLHLISGVGVDSALWKQVNNRALVGMYTYECNIDLAAVHGINEASKSCFYIWEQHFLERSLRSMDDKSVGLPSVI